MNRRWLLASIAATPFLAPRASHGQPATPPMVAILSEGIESDLAARATIAALRAGLEAEGLVEGRDLRLELAFVSFYPEFIPDRIEALLAKGLRVIVSLSSTATRSARAATSIPIVMAPNADPVAEGLVESLAQPGGNVTGVSMQSDELWPKKIELLGEVVPGLRRIAIMGEINTSAGQDRLARAAGDAEDIGLEVLKLGIRGSEDFRPSLAKAVAEGAQGLLLLEDVAMVGRQRSVIAYYTLQVGLPSIATDRTYADDGILMSYGANVQDLQRRVAGYVRRLLDGADPSRLPVEQPTRFELVVNLATAARLGLELPRGLRLRADALVE